MNSPFPGMDPWLERKWGSFHTLFIVGVFDALVEGLPQDLRADIEVDVLVEWVAAGEREKRRPDATVQVREPPAAYADEGGVGVMERPVATPTRVSEWPPRKQRSIRVHEAGSGERVIAAFELLSPTNKRRGRGLEAYLRKQREFVEAGLHLLELDLLRSGEPVTLASDGLLQEDDPGPYHVSLFDALAGRTSLFAVALEDPLPKVLLPLREGDEPVAIDFQAVLDGVLARGRWARDFDYATDPPGPPLDPAERSWVDERVAGWRSVSAA